MLYNLVARKSIFITYLLSFLLIVFCMLFSIVEQNEAVLSSLIFYGLVGAIAFYFHHVLSNYKLASPKDFSVLLFTSVALCSLEVSSETTRLLIGLLLSIKMTERIMSLYNQYEMPIAEFELGALIGLAYLAHPIFAFSSIMVVTSITIVKANKWRDYVALVIGILFILALKASYYVFMDKTLTLDSIIWFPYQLKSFAVLSSFQTVVLGCLSLFSLIVLNSNKRISDTMNIKERIYHKSFRFFFFFFAPFPFIIQNGLSIPQIALFILIPIIALSQPFFMKDKKWLFNDIMTLFVLFSAFYTKFY